MTKKKKGVCVKFLENSLSPEAYKTLTRMCYCYDEDPLGHYWKGDEQSLDAILILLKMREEDSLKFKLKQLIKKIKKLKY